MFKRRLCTSLVPYGYYNNPNSLFGFGLGIFVTATSGIFAIFTVFATKEDLNNGINRLDKKIDESVNRLDKKIDESVNRLEKKIEDSNEMLRREMKNNNEILQRDTQNNTKLILERIENMLLKSKR